MVEFRVRKIKEEYGVVKGVLLALSLGSEG